MLHTATLVTIIVERLLEDKVTQIIKKAGATGYTIVEGSGKGQRGQHLTKGPAIINAFSIVKIEFVVKDKSVAIAVAEDVEKTCFNNYSGIVFLSEVEILRKEKFQSLPPSK